MEALLLMIALLQTPPVKNPTAVIFTCPDHDQDTGHEVDIVRLSDGAVIQTLQGGDPPVDGNGEVTIALNVQPIDFGRYRVVVRATADPVKGDSSVPDPNGLDVFDRTPGKPTKVRIGG